MSNVIQVCKVQSYLSIDKLKLHPKNPRTIRPERLEELKASIRKKGVYKPFLVWKKGGITLDGNHRAIAVRELIEEGFEFQTPDGKTNMMPVVIEDVSEAEAMAILLESNNTYADWIEEKLRAAIQDAEEKGQDVKEFGFTQDYLDALLKDAEKDADDALKALGTERGVEPVDATKLREAMAEEEFESLVLPKGIYEQLTDILGKIAKAINDEWMPGDSLAEATQALCQSIYESDMLSEITDKVDEEKPH